MLFIIIFFFVCYLMVNKDEYTSTENLYSSCTRLPVHSTSAKYTCGMLSWNTIHKTVCTNFFNIIDQLSNETATQMFTNCYHYICPTKLNQFSENKPLINYNYFRGYFLGIIVCSPSKQLFIILPMQIFYCFLLNSPHFCLLNITVQSYVLSSSHLIHMLQKSKLSFCYTCNYFKPQVSRVEMMMIKFQ